MKKKLIALFSLLPASLTLLSCGSTTPSNTQTSGLKYRAFISSNVSAGSEAAGVYIVNAQTDVRPVIQPISAGNNPGMMVETPTLGQTLVFSSIGTQFSDNQFTVINNANESVAGHLTLAGGTESFVVSPDASTSYIAVPTAPVVGQSPGLLEVVSLSGSVAFTGQAPIPSLHYLAINNGGTRLLGFSDNSDQIAVITPTNIQSGNAVTYVTGFDRPVAAFFSSDDTIAYVINCGEECGGSEASVQMLNMTTGIAGNPVGVCTSGGAFVCAASEAFLNGSTMYLAGSYQNPEPTQACPGQVLLSPTCGMLTIFDLSSMGVITTGIAITDGYHNRIALGANGQLFIGARTCTQNPGVSGCLSIYNTLTTAVGTVPAGGVIIPPAPGDVTGIEPINHRAVVYVAQGGEVWIYDTSFDGLEDNPNNPNNPGLILNLVGYFIDVKVVDF